MGMIYVFNSGWIVKEIIEQLDNMPIKMQILESTFRIYIKNAEFRNKFSDLARHSHHAVQ